jgi:type III pantothenate kinase
MSTDLFIDLGNSRIKWMSEAQPHQDAAEYADAEIAALLDRIWKRLPPPGRVWLASVAAPGVQEAVRTWVWHNWRIVPQSISVQPVACGVTCAYRDPAQLGVDRWMAILGAYRLNPGGVCVVDCGTATTLDVVNDAGVHLGGYILPGMEMMRESLLQGTAMLPGTAVTGSMEWGNSTASCIDLGIRKSVVSLIEQSVERMQASGVCDPGVVVTGGGCALIEPHLQLAFEHREPLVLEGMMTFVQEQNR